MTTAATFSHIKRIQDPRFPHEIAAIMPGEHFVGETPMVVYTVLGSCVSACIRDPLLNIGGMNHFMLPEPEGIHGSDSWADSGRYGSFAMELLINAILSLGGCKARLEVKLFGGARIYQDNEKIGLRNAEWALEYLRDEGLHPTKVDVGQTCPRKVYYFTETGRVLLKKIERLKNRTIHEREAQYEASLKHRDQTESEVTLF